MAADGAQSTTQRYQFTSEIVNGALDALVHERRPPPSLLADELAYRSFAVAYDVLRSIVAAPSAKRVDTANEVLADRVPMNARQTFMDVLKLSACGPDVDGALARRRPRLAGVESLAWRINVYEASQYFASCLLPFIALTLRLSDGSELQFEMSIGQFHRLRLALARCQRHLLSLAARPALQQ